MKPLMLLYFGKSIIL